MMVTDTTRPRGFTLVELVVVILILGVLAGIAAPRLVDQGEDAAVAAFASQLRLMIAASERCKVVTGEFPSDSFTGTLPPEIEPFLNTQGWNATTPLGGKWDWEFQSRGVRAAVGIYIETNELVSGIEDVDALRDDGNLDTGSLSYIDLGRYYYVLEE